MAKRYLALGDGECETGPCILCGDHTKLTGEHIFAHWISRATCPTQYPDLQLILKTPDSSLVERFNLTNFKAPRNKGFSNVRLNVLCDSCNSGWGSELQEQTSKVLKPILQGDPLLLDDSARQIVATWMTSFVIVRQFLHPELNSISEETRLEFFKTKKPMNGISIWVARYDGANAYESPCRTLTIFKETDKTPPTPNTGFLTMNIGNLIFFALWSSAQSFINDFSPGTLRCIPLINMLSASEGLRQFTPNPAQQQKLTGFSENLTYPLHSLMMDLGMRQVWPLFSDFNSGDEVTLHRSDFDDLNNIVTHVLLTYDHSLANARANVGVVEKHLFSFGCDSR
jgi:hypothetical protein